MGIILDISCGAQEGLWKFFPAYLQKRGRRYLWNMCEEMTFA